MAKKKFEAYTFLNWLRFTLTDSQYEKLKILLEGNVDAFYQEVSRMEIRLEIL